MVSVRDELTTTVAVAEKTVAQAWAEISDKPREEKAAIASRKLQYILDEPYGENGLTGSLTQLADMMIGVRPEKSEHLHSCNAAAKYMVPLCLALVAWTLKRGATQIGGDVGPSC